MSTEAERARKRRYYLRRKRGADGPHVYVMAHNIAGRAVAPVKIGKTTMLALRLRTCQSGNPHALVFAIVVPVGTAAAATSIEKAMHAQFAGDRMLGEWFNVAPAAAVAALRGMVNGG